MIRGAASRFRASLPVPRRIDLLDVDEAKNPGESDPGRVAM
jgi:hypothetical protein